MYAEHLSYPYPVVSLALCDGFRDVFLGAVNCALQQLHGGHFRMALKLGLLFTQ
jgi:hypothetical protein